MDKLRSIEYFMRVAEAGSIAAAANALEVTPSSVSKVLTALEESLGFTLFHRSTRRISLTEQGMAYLERCRQIMRDLDEAEAQGRQKRSTPSGLVKVGMHPAFRNQFFARIASVLNRYPLLRIETRMSNSPSVLFDEGFDLLVRAGDLPDSNVVAKPIGRLEMVVAAAPSYLEHFGEPKTPADLEHHRWILPARVDNYLGSSPNWEFTRGKERCSVSVQSYVTARDSIGLPESAIGGVGIVCGYSIAFDQPIEEGLLKRLLPGWTIFSRPVFAVFPNAKAITPKSQVLVDFFADLVAGAGKAGTPR